MNQINPYKFSPIFQIVNSSQKCRIEIINEYNKLLDYYMEHPEDFKTTLEQAIHTLEMNEHRTPTEESTLNELYEMIEREIAPEDYFSFGEDNLLDDFRKIYKQIRDKYPISSVQNNDEVDVLYYVIGNSMDIPVGDMTPEGVINTGSRILLDRMRVRAKDFLVQYQMLNN